MLSVAPRTSTSAASPRARLHALCVEQANALPDEAALRWLLEHRLLLLHDHPALRPSLRAQLARTRLRTLAANLRLVRLYHEVVDALGDLPVAPLKGLALLDTLYRDDPGLRPLSDLDLLVPGDLAEEAVARLAPLGLVETRESRSLRSVMHHRHLTGPRGPVELHTRLSRAFGDRSGWADLPLVRSTCHGRPAWALPPAADLAYHLAHASAHRLFSRVLWVDEALAAADRWAGPVPDPDLAVHARRLGVAVALGDAVAVLRAVLGPDVLPQVPAGLVESPPLRLRMVRWLLAPPPAGAPWRLGTRNSWVEKARLWALSDRPLSAALEYARLVAVRAAAGAAGG